MPKPQRPHAAHLRLGRISLPGQVYVLTMVTRDRRPVFRDFACARTVVRFLREHDRRGVARTLCFVVMPDHVHWMMELGTICDLGEGSTAHLSEAGVGVCRSPALRANNARGRKVAGGVATRERHFSAGPAALLPDSEKACSRREDQLAQHRHCRVAGRRPAFFQKKRVVHVNRGGFDKTGKGNKTPDTRDTQATDFPIHHQHGQGGTHNQTPQDPEQYNKQYSKQTGSKERCHS